MDNNKGEKRGKLWSRIGGSSTILYCIIFFFGVLFMGKLILSFVDFDNISNQTLDSFLLILGLILTYIFFVFVSKKK
ncbi:MAG: hypothetical protein ACRC2K_02360 [Clostridium sp.]